MATSMKMKIFMNFASCDLVEINRYFRGLGDNPDDGGSKNL
jgi:hypothetical protein